MDNKTILDFVPKLYDVLVQIKENEGEKNKKITYGDLAEKALKDRDAAQFLDEALGVILIFCHRHDLPMLSALVVNWKSRIPGNNFFNLYEKIVPIEKQKKYEELLREIEKSEVPPPEMRTLLIKSAGKLLIEMKFSKK